MKALFIVLIISVIISISIAKIVNRESPEPDRSHPEVKSSATPDLGSRDAEMVVGAYIRAAQDNNEKALLGYIADLATLPHRQLSKGLQPSPPSNLDDNRAGRRMGTIDEVGHDFLLEEGPQYIRELDLRISKIESICSAPDKCRVRVFFEKFKNREIVHDYIVYHIDGADWKIVSVLPSLITS